jgi:hypothetical protein
MARKTLYFLAIAACVAGMAYGAWRGEFREIWFNGSTL